MPSTGWPSRSTKSTRMRKKAGACSSRVPRIMWTPKMTAHRSRRRASSHGLPARGSISCASRRAASLAGVSAAADLASVVEAEAAQLFRVPLPVLGDLDPQVQVDPGPEQRLDLAAGLRADLLQPRALGADHDRLLAGPLDVHDRVDVDEVGAAFPGRHLLDDNRDGVRQLIPYAFEDRLPDKLRDQLLLRLVGLVAMGVQRPAGRQVRDEHVSQHAGIEAGE